MWYCRHWVWFESLLYCNVGDETEKNKTIKKCTVYNRHGISNINSDYQWEICVINDPIKKKKKNFFLSHFLFCVFVSQLFVAFDYQTIATLFDIKVNCNLSMCPVIIAAHCYYFFYNFHANFKKKNIQFKNVMISMLCQISIGIGQQRLCFFLFLPSNQLIHN